MLLHPLKSELNFPIGHRDKIDLFGYRWELPIFILDAIVSTRDELARGKAGAGGRGEEEGGEGGEGGDDVAIAAAIAGDGGMLGSDDDGDDMGGGAAAAGAPPAPSAPTMPMLRRQSSNGANTRNSQSSQWQAAQRKAGLVGSDISAAVAAALSAGRESRRMQTVPHMVLLDADFYRDEIMPHVARWVLLWLHQNFEEEAGLRIGAAAIAAAEEAAAGAAAGGSGEDRRRALVSKQLYRLETDAASALAVARASVELSDAATAAAAATHDSAAAARVAAEQAAPGLVTACAAAAAAKDATDLNAGAQAAGNLLLLSFLMGEAPLAKCALFDELVEPEESDAAFEAEQVVAEGQRERRVEAVKAELFGEKLSFLMAAGEEEGVAFAKAEDAAAAQAEEQVRGEEAEASRLAARSVEVTPRLTAHDMKLLNLATDWLGCYLPHCISKVRALTDTSPLVLFPYTSTDARLTPLLGVVHSSHFSTCRPTHSLPRHRLQRSTASRTGCWTRTTPRATRPPRASSWRCRTWARTCRRAAPSSRTPTCSSA